MVCLPDDDTNFFDIVVGVLQGDTLVQYSTICQDYIIWMSIDLIKENAFTLKLARSRWYPAETMRNADYTADLMLLTNTPAQAESLLLSLEQAAGGIGLYMNTNKTEFICFKWEDLRLVDKLTYFSSNISSIKSGFNILITKVCITIDRLSIIWKSDLSNEIKWDFFQSCSCVNTTVWMHYMATNEMHEEKAR